MRKSAQQSLVFKQGVNDTGDILMHQVHGLILSKFIITETYRFGNSSNIPPEVSTFVPG